MLRLIIEHIGIVEAKEFISSNDEFITAEGIKNFETSTYRQHCISVMQTKRLKMSIYGFN